MGSARLALHRAGWGLPPLAHWPLAGLRAPSRGRRQGAGPSDTLTKEADGLLTALTLQGHAGSHEVKVTSELP